MWFMAPEGTNGSISVQQMELQPLVLAGPLRDGKPTERVLYEVPDRFAHHLAGLPGFMACPSPTNLPEGYVSPVPNPESQTIEALASQVAFHQRESADKTSLLDLFQSKLDTVSFQRDELQRELVEVKTQLSNALFDLEEVNKQKVAAVDKKE
jgi:hypothetical protein